jgi:hypothetical protein
MAPILGIYASQISGHLFAPSGAYDSIATTTVGAGGVSSVTFSSIPSTYTHLQVRFISKLSAGDDVIMRFNGDTANNYWNHILYGNGSSATASVPFSGAYSGIALYYTGSTASVAGGVIDVLDYTSTSKNKTVRFLGGYDDNGSGNIDLASGSWSATPAAINSIVIKPVSANFAQYTQIALYGIRGN